MQRFDGGTKHSSSRMNVFHRHKCTQVAALIFNWTSEVGPLQCLSIDNVMVVLLSWLQAMQTYKQ